MGARALAAAGQGCDDRAVLHLAALDVGRVAAVGLRKIAAGYKMSLLISRLIVSKVNFLPLSPKKSRSDQID